MIKNLPILFMLTAAVASGQEAADLARTIMFGPGLDPRRVEQLIRLCGVQPDGFQMVLAPEGKAPGVLMVFRYQTELTALQKTILTHHKELIFKRSIIEHDTNLPLPELEAAQASDSLDLDYHSTFTVLGKFGTRFQYRMRTRVWKRPGWILERERMEGEAELVQGWGGKIDYIGYFTLLAGTGPRQTLRVVANWTQAGGKVPVIGEIVSKPQDIIEGINKGHQDLLDYLEQP